MPTTLKRLQIENWKSIRRTDLTFGTTNVLIGPNGSGKSNVVQFFQMLNMMMTGSLGLFVGRAGGAGSLLHYGPKTIQVTCSLDFETDTGTDTYSFKLLHGAPDTFVFGSENVKFVRRGHDGNPYFREFGSGHKESAIDANSAGSNQTIAVVRQILSSCRYFQFHDTSSESYIRLTAREDDDKFLRADGGNTAAILRRLQKEHPENFRAISEMVKSVVPAFGSFELEPDNGVLLRWRDRHRGELFGPHQLSDGTTRFIALATLLNLPPVLMPAVVIIDEPELGLFPTAVDALAQAIKHVGVRSQVILATQSVRLVRYLNE